MKSSKKTSTKIVANIIKIRKDRNIKQADIAAFIDIDPATYSKIESGKIELTVERLAEIASFFKLDIVDVIHWPHKYVKYDSLPSKDKESRHPKVTIQIELNDDKKEKVLDMIFEGKEIDVFYS